MTRIIFATLAGTVALTALQAQPPGPAATPPQSQQPSEIVTVITGAPGQPPRFAVPDFIALPSPDGRPPDKEVQEAAATIGRVLWDDLAFEREFALMPRDVVATVAAGSSPFDVPFDRWRELNADGVIVGTVRKTTTGVEVEVRLFNVQSRNVAFGRQYSGPIASRRRYAHRIADEIHETQRALKGVAQTRLTFNSDRSGERMTGTVENRGVKEIFISDYDGEGQQQVTTNRSLNITSAWSPDGRSLVYTSYRRGQPNIFIANIFDGTSLELTKNADQNWTPAWSPDGTRIAFSSTRDGNSEIYVANRDGSNARRLTNHPANDITPTWSPSGTQIAFTSSRRGEPQIYVMDADGLNLAQITSESYADRPTWSPAPFNEIAYAARTGPGNDVKVINMATRQVRQLTFGEGTNESPSFAPNGRHLAFSSTRAGRSQIFTIAQDGKDVRLLSRAVILLESFWYIVL
jgi:TolB protein